MQQIGNKRAEAIVPANPGEFPRHSRHAWDTRGIGRLLMKGRADIGRIAVKRHMRAFKRLAGLSAILARVGDAPPYAGLYRAGGYCFVPGGYAVAGSMAGM